MPRQDHNLPSNPLPSAAELAPKVGPETVMEQGALMLLLNSPEFTWFIETCIRTKRLAHQRDLEDVGFPMEKVDIARNLRAELLSIETWCETRKTANQQLLDAANKTR